MADCEPAWVEETRQALAAEPWLSDATWWRMPWPVYREQERVKAVRLPDIDAWTT